MTLEIVEKLGDRYTIACGHGRRFQVPRHAVSVECPRCGATAPTSDLVLARLFGRPRPADAPAPAA